MRQIDPFENSVAQFESYLRLERQSSSNTIAAYMRALNKWKTWCDQADHSPMDVTREDIADFVHHLHESALAVTSISQVMAALRSWINFRRLEGERKPLWLPKLPEKPAQLPQILTEGEVERLINACQGEAFEDVRDMAMMVMLADCGLRATEICSLTLADIDREGRFFRVRGKGDKERTVPFTATVLEHLDQWLEIREEMFPKAFKRPVFLNAKGVAMNRIDLWRLIRQRGSSVGIAKTRLHPHVLRHTIATRLLRRGMDLRSLQELLGHSSIGTTEKYLHFDLELRDVYDRCHPHAGSPKEVN